jgi:hypothetical protein
LSRGSVLTVGLIGVGNGGAPVTAQKAAPLGHPEVVGDVLPGRHANLARPFEQGGATAGRFTTQIMAAWPSWSAD